MKCVGLYEYVRHDLHDKIELNYMVTFNLKEMLTCIIITQNVKWKVYLKSYVFNILKHYKTTFDFVHKCYQLFIFLKSLTNIVKTFVN